VASPLREHPAARHSNPATHTLPKPPSQPTCSTVACSCGNRSRTAAGQLASSVSGRGRWDQPQAAAVGAACSEAGRCAANSAHGWLGLLSAASTQPARGKKVSRQANGH